MAGKPAAGETQQADTTNQAGAQEGQTAEVISADEQAAADDLSAGFQKASSARLESQGKPAQQPEQRQDRPQGTQAAAQDGQQQDGAHGSQATNQPATGTSQAPAQGAQDALIAGMTHAELRAALDKAAQFDSRLQQETDRFHGKVGELNRTIEQLKTTLATGRPATASGRKFTADLLKRVDEELPGMGKALAEDLQAIFDSPETQAGAQQAQANATANGQVFDHEAYYASKISPALQSMETKIAEQYEEKMQNNLVRFMHRDFDTVTQSKEFKDWFATLPPQKQTEIYTSPDAMVAGDAVSDFKAAHKAKVAKQQKQTNRLTENLLPQGDGAAGGSQQNSADDDLSAGFNKVNKRRQA